MIDINTILAWIKIGAFATLFIHHIFLWFGRKNEIYMLMYALFNFGFLILNIGFRILHYKPAFYLGVLISEYSIIIFLINFFKINYKKYLLFPFLFFLLIKVIIILFSLFNPDIKYNNLMFFSLVLISGILSASFIVISLVFKIYKTRILPKLTIISISFSLVIILCIRAILNAFTNLSSLDAIVNTIIYGLILSFSMVIALIVTKKTNFEHIEYKKSIMNKKIRFKKFCAYYNITQREEQVVEILIKGNSYKEIGDRLFISKYTVKTHIQNVYKKTKVNSNIALYKLIDSYS